MIRFQFTYHDLPVQIVTPDKEFRSWLIADDMFLKMGIYDEGLSVTIKPLDNSKAFPGDDEGLFVDQIGVDFFALKFDGEAHDRSGGDELFAITQREEAVELFKRIRMPDEMINKAYAEYKRALVGAYLMRDSGGGYRTTESIYEHSAQSWRDANIGG